MDPRPTALPNLREGIENVAPRFAETYRQVLLAEQDGLSELVGMGYRKALELLIKEWLISQKVDPALVERKTVGACIHDHVQDHRIKTAASRATWLGNDETHFMRKWADMDVQDLKALFDLTLHWITSEMGTQRYAAAMPGGGE
jgi:hypothetical protein